MLTLPIVQQHFVTLFTARNQFLCIFIPTATVCLLSYKNKCNINIYFKCKIPNVPT